jgi:hypothetical protein
LKRDRRVFGEIDVPSVSLALNEAAAGGHYEIVEYLFNQTLLPSSTADVALISACKTPIIGEARSRIYAGDDRLKKIQEEINAIQGPMSPQKSSKMTQLRQLEDMHKISTAKYQTLVENYCKLVMFLCESGAKQLTKATVAAAKAGNCEIVEFLADAGIPHLERALTVGAANGHAHVTKALLDAGGITDLNPALCAAAGFGSIPCLELLVEAGADDLNLAMLQADCFKHEEAKAWLSERCDKGYLAIIAKQKEEDDHKAKLQERKRAAAERRVKLNAERALEIEVEKEETRRERAEVKTAADKEEALRLKWASQHERRKEKKLSAYAHSINTMRKAEADKAEQASLDRIAAAKAKAQMGKSVNVKDMLEQLQEKLEDGLEDWKATESDGKLWQHGIQRREDPVRPKFETLADFDDRRGREHWWKDDYKRRIAMKNRKDLMTVKADKEAHERRVVKAVRLPYAPMH